MSTNFAASSALTSPQLAAQVAEHLARHVTDVVLCPGSRNSAVALAVLQRPELRVHIRIDERSAAFLALGIGRASGRHAAVITTSGTAVANCYPAVVEAAMSHTPLAIVSADRPARYVGTGASQTIDQEGIFGVYANTTYLDAESPLVPAIDQAFEQYTVHLNVAFDTPLVDTENPVAAPAETQVPTPFVPTAYDNGEVAVDLGLKTLVIAGDEAWEVPGLEDVPTIAEPSAPTPEFEVHPLAAGIFGKGSISTGENTESPYAEYVADVRPEQIIVVGHPTLHRGVLALMSDPSLRIITLSRTNIFTDPENVAQERGSRVRITGEVSKQWRTICEAVSEIAEQAVVAILDDSSFGFNGLQVAAAVCDHLEYNDLAFFGPSNPVRDAALAGIPAGEVETYSPRGAAGIDGVVSQAIGVALESQARDKSAVRSPRTVALLGDVTFLHDVGGLLLNPDTPHPENLVMVVANDNGGGIFESLEIGAPALRDGFERAVGTPHGVDIEKIAEAYGVDYRRADTLAELIEALDDHHEYAGFTIIEARTTRATRRDMDAALRAKLGL